MLKITVENCVGCEVCIDKCPYNALYMRDNIAVVDEDKCTLCGVCVEHCSFDAIELITKYQKDTSYLKQYEGIWVLAEQREGELLNVSIELIGEARKLAKKKKTEVTAVLAGNNLSRQAKKLIARGADKVFLLENSELEDYRTEPYTQAISNLIEKEKPEIVLLGATNNGRDLGPRLAAKLDTGLTADCTELDIDTEKEILLQTRPAFGGNLMATIVCPEHRPQMATVRPGVMMELEEDGNRTGEIIKLNPEIKEQNMLTKIKEIIKEPKTSINLEKANIIVAGGRGVGCPENFSLIEKLAETVDGEVGASRAVVDEGWIQKEHQVGQTGKTVKPTLYIACGISGAIQHKAGMQNSDYIIAINKDPEAPIFDICDYGIIGDLKEIIPELIEEIA
ncbi:MAG: FAD-binding protein [Bacillota bacterium]